MISETGADVAADVDISTVIHAGIVAKDNADMRVGFCAGFTAGAGLPGLLGNFF